MSIAELAQEFERRMPFTMYHDWFTEGFKPVTGVDVSETSFDFEEKRLFAQHMRGQINVSALVLRAEDGELWGQILRSYLPGIRTRQKMWGITKCMQLSTRLSRMHIVIRPALCKSSAQASITIFIQKMDGRHLYVMPQLDPDVCVDNLLVTSEEMLFYMIRANHEHVDADHEASDVHNGDIVLC